MAKRERNKRAARKARQQERARVEAAQAAAAAGQPEKSRSIFKGKDKSSKPAAKTNAVAKADRKGIARVTGYFADVRSEMRQVTWPSGPELRNYSVAVIAMLIVFGVLIWAVDTGFVAALVQDTGLRG